MSILFRSCPGCNQRHQADFFPPGDPQLRCKFCRKNRRMVTDLRKKRPDDQRYRMWVSSRNRSHQSGMEHTIHLTDIPLPKYCCYLGVELLYYLANETGADYQWNLASLDRIDSSRGYVPGNIQVISFLANKMKQDATIEQLLAFAEGVIRTHRS